MIKRHLIWVNSHHEDLFIQVPYHCKDIQLSIQYSNYILIHGLFNIPSILVIFCVSELLFDTVNDYHIIMQPMLPP